MRANNAQGNLNDDRQREHQRQQERLKAMISTSDKSQMVSADMMIENLLKDSFKKKPQVTSPVNQSDHSNSDIPVWLQCESAAVPAQYKYFWGLVQSTVDLADTQKVSQLLLTSGLHLDLLGFIWNLANKAIPGQLTKQEFYIVLALVGLAQTGYTFNNLSILKLITVPSIPVLQVGMQNYPPPQPYVQNVGTTNLSTFNGISSALAFQSKPCDSLNVSDMNEGSLINSATMENVLSNDHDKNLVGQEEFSRTGLNPTFSSSNTPEHNLFNQTKGPTKNSNFPCIGSSPTAEFEDDFSAFQSVSKEKTEDQKNTSEPVFDSGDDFTEFQSANVEHLDPFETVVIIQKREIPKIPLPKSFTGKLTNLKTNILKISPETEKKLKVLSPTESLSSLPESKISTSNKVSTSISVLGSNQGIGSRLANHSFNAKLDRPKCHKHHKIKINPISPVHPNAEDEIILGVKPRNLESVIPKCRPKNSSTCKTIILKETKISSDSGDSSLSEHLGTELDSSILPSGENTRQIEIPMLGTFNETVLPTQSKSQTSSIDLISVQEDKYSALREIELELNQEKNSEPKEVNDDFGDFLSADIPPPPVPVPVPVPQTTTQEETGNSTPDMSIKNEEKEDWGDWNFSTETNLTSILSLDPPQVKPFGDVNEPSGFKPEEDLFDTFTSLTVNEKQNNQTSQPDSQDQQDLWVDAKVDNTFDVNIFEVKNEKTDDTNIQPKTDSDNEFWEFLSSDIKPTTDEENFHRHGSVPSLDLKIPTTDESEQETVWRKCLDSCLGLIQEGYEIFNNINTKSVLDEVFGAPKTEDYLNYLNTAFQISKRVSKNLNPLPTTLEDLERLWGRIQDLCFEYNIKLKHDEDNSSEGKVRCNICLSRIGFDLISQGSGSYHPSCANLWINCIDSTLPFSV